jgi:hypothetical protein
MKTLLYFFMTLFFFIFSAAKIEAVSQEEVRVLARIHSHKGALELQTVPQHRTVPFRLKNKKFEKVMKDLRPNQEVILSGYITQETIKDPEHAQVRSLFVVSEIRPISLQELGRLQDFKPEEKLVTLKLQPDYAPKSIPVSGKTAAAITITASILLLKSLANSSNMTSLGKELENTLIFSAGALTTGSQVLEDLNKSDK